MSRLTVSSPKAPTSIQSMFRQWMQPWRMEESLIDAMFRPGFALMDPAFNQSFDSIVRRFANSMRLHESFLGGMDVNVDVVEKNGAYRVHADLPGMKKEDITVRIDGNVVNIEAKTQDSIEQKGADGKVVFNERYSGSVSRSFALDQEIDEAKASGKYADGVLTLDLPKKPGTSRAESKPIAIQ